MKEDFYIGWSDENPRSLKKLGNWFFASVLVVALLVAAVFSLNEKGFIDSYYEFGVFQEVTGYLVDKPVWALRTVEEGVVKTIPLVGFGKMGAEWTLSEMMKTSEVDAGTIVTMRGMIFYYQGRRWMELTEMQNSLVKVETSELMKQEVKILGQKTLRGEIVDPKCLFGVMNPADKAVHRSCAIRCISGGMPPILAIREKGEFIDYYFLKDEDFNPVNEHVLPYIGLPVELSGHVVSYDDWKVLQIDGNRTKLVSSNVDQIAICK